MTNFVIPSPFKSSYTCPACGSYSYHDDLPVFNNRNDHNVYVLNNRNGEGKFGENYQLVFKNCHACGHISIFRIKGRLEINKFTFYSNYELIYPQEIDVPEPNPDMPEHVKDFYNEARNVSKCSTRAATALLRIATEKLVKDLLGLKGKEYSETKMHHAIERLKNEKDLNLVIYNALLSLKLFGNEATHPDIDIDRLESYFSHDKDLMNKLFMLINIIVDELISKPKQIMELFENAPRK